MVLIRVRPAMFGEVCVCVRACACSFLGVCKEWKRRGGEGARQARMQGGNEEPALGIMQRATGRRSTVGLLERAQSDASMLRLETGRSRGCIPAGTSSAKRQPRTTLFVPS